MTVPDPVGYDADHLAAFNRVNELRVAAGLGMLAQNADIDKASQAHAQWEFDNMTFSHVETAGTHGFTGVNWWDRMIAQGYPLTDSNGHPLNNGGEVLAEDGTSSDAVDALFNAVYHREAILNFRPVDIGVGWVPGRVQLLGTELALDYGWPADGGVKSNGQTAQAAIDGVAIWPVDGATSVPYMNGDETPDPVPSLPVTYLGTAASVSVDLAMSIEVDSFSMTRTSDGVVVDVVLLDQASDPNQRVTPSFVAIVPKSWLTPETEYTVTFDGTIIGPAKTDRRAYSRTWAFTTGPVWIP